MQNSRKTCHSHFWSHSCRSSVPAPEPAQPSCWCHFSVTGVFVPLGHPQPCRSSGSSSGLAEPSWSLPTSPPCHWDVLWGSTGMANPGNAAQGNQGHGRDSQSQGSSELRGAAPAGTQIYVVCSFICSGCSKKCSFAMAGSGQPLRHKGILLQGPSEVTAARDLGHRMCTVHSCDGF